ncbi:MAG: hypothetical protein CMC48_09735 [Flavobacteriaceae bacterium]|nr:hypothetical protein [Flavobacteriaceae bacterium]|tara:strand:+ start:920 stop:1138 length:219 start_codon:yes stop_codon:yes gene_type:complete
MEKGIIINTQTNEVSEVERSEAEIAERKARAETKLSEFEAEQTAKQNLKNSARAKLMAGEALTEEEANTIVI